MTTASPEFDPNDPVASFGAMWKRVVLEPRAFFESLPPAGGPSTSAGIRGDLPGDRRLRIHDFRRRNSGVLGLFVIGLLRLFVGSAIVALVAQQLFDGRGDYEATFRAVAYSTAVAVGIGIPVVKYFAALYGAYLAIIGIAKAQSFDTVRALLTVLASAFAGLVIVYALGTRALGWPREPAAALSPRRGQLSSSASPVPIRRKAPRSSARRLRLASVSRSDWHWTHRRVNGMTFRRSAVISPSQLSQIPYVPSSMRSSA